MAETYAEETNLVELITEEVSTEGANTVPPYGLRVEKKKSLEEKQAADRKILEDLRANYAKKAADRKAAEEKQEAERKALEEKKAAERKAAAEKQAAEEAKEANISSRRDEYGLAASAFS